MLLTKFTFTNPESLVNATNTFDELLKLGVIPIVNENDTIATDEIDFGDNDTLSAEIAKLTDSDLLILLSDIDGLYNKDPHKNEDAELIRVVEAVDEKIDAMAELEVILEQAA